MNTHDTKDEPTSTPDDSPSPSSPVSPAGSSSAPGGGAAAAVEAATRAVAASRAEAATRRKRLAVRVGVVAVVVAVAATAIVWRALAGRDTGGQGAGGPVASASASAPAPSPTPSAAPVRNPVPGALNYLIVGNDFRAGAKGEPSHADTIMIVHIPANRTAAYVISIARDSLVNIPGRGQDKINAGLAYGGPALQRRTMEAVTGVKFDGAVFIEFRGFTRIIQVLGGVDVCLDRPVKSIHTNITYPKGCQHLHEHAALDVVRQRKDQPNGDYDRTRNGQKVLAATVGKAASAQVMTNPAKIQELLKAVGSTVVIESRAALVDLAWELRGYGAGSFVGITVPGSAVNDGGGYAGERMDPAKSARIFAALRNDTLYPTIAN